jgi:microcystin degradation protein MlrC
MVVPILGGWTDEGAMRQVMLDAAEIAAGHSLVSYSVFHGFGYTDVPQIGSSIVAVAEADPAAATSAARGMALRLWDRRQELSGDALTPAAAIEEAQRRVEEGRTVVLLDIGDNVGAGAPGDSTVLLEAGLAAGVDGLVATICDQAAVRHARARGVGADVTLTLGGANSTSSGPGVSVAGRVTKITDGRFEDPDPAHGGFRFFDGGPTVRVSMAGGQDVVISSRAVPSWSPEQLVSMGIETRGPRVIIAKGVTAPRAGYARVASDFLLVDTPGVTAADLSRLPYRHRRKPLWPLDPDAAFEPA